MAEFANYLSADGLTLVSVWPDIGKASESTVKTQTASVLLKLDAYNAAHAVHIAHLKGLLP